MTRPTIEERRLNVAFSGSRTFRDRYLVGDLVDEVLNRGHRILVGDAKSGVDLFVRQYAESFEAELELSPGALHKVFAADWETFGKPAGHIRNGWMMDEAGGLIALFDPHGVTPGTLNALRHAQRRRLPTRVYRDAQWTGPEFYRAAPPSRSLP